MLVSQMVSKKSILRGCRHFLHLKAHILFQTPENRRKCCITTSHQISRKIITRKKSCGNCNSGKVTKIWRTFDKKLKKFSNFFEFFWLYFLCSLKWCSPKFAIGKCFGMQIEKLYFFLFLKMRFSPINLPSKRWEWLFLVFVVSCGPYKSPCQYPFPET